MTVEWLAGSLRQRAGFSCAEIQERPGGPAGALLGSIVPAHGEHFGYEDQGRADKAQPVHSCSEVHSWTSIAAEAIPLSPEQKSQQCPCGLFNLPGIGHHSTVGSASVRTATDLTQCDTRSAGN